MYFCPKCNYTFDISKATKDDSSDTRKELNEPNDAFKRLKADKDLSNYIAKFSREDLENTSIYKSLSDDMKEKLDVLFQKNISTSNIEFKCNNCNYRKKIRESIKLYEMNVNSTHTIYHSIEDNKLLAMNPIYPRTKDYECKNINCITHKDDKLKEAVFYREKDSYVTNYICNVCFNSWKV
jgi:DNA-directed RNA polymerase subunit M/transcription elongation factor TFIIS